MQIAAVELLAHSKRMHNIMSTAGCRSSSRMQIAAVRGECRNRLFAESLAAQVQIGVDIEQGPRMPYPCQRRLHPQNRIFVTCFTTHRANEVLIMVGDFLWHACQPERKTKNLRMTMTVTITVNNNDDDDENGDYGVMMMRMIMRRVRKQR